MNIDRRSLLAGIGCLGLTCIPGPHLSPPGRPIHPPLVDGTRLPGRCSTGCKNKDVC